MGCCFALYRLIGVAHRKNGIRNAIHSSSPARPFLARQDSRYVGTLGATGCFSLQQGKHITTGEGGLVVTNNDALARRMVLFVNKA